MVDNIENIKKDLIANKLVIFVGSDVSAYTANDDKQVACWKILVQHALYELSKISDEDFNEDIQKLNDSTTDIDEYNRIINRANPYLQEHTDAYQCWLNDTIGKLFPHKPELIQALADFRCPIVTTNYDSLLENALHRKSLTWEQYRTDPSLQSLDVHHILHLHGHYQYASSIVLNSDQLFQDKITRMKFLKLVQGKTLLFIGYGTQQFDPDFSNILKWIFNLSVINRPAIYKLIRSTAQCSILENFVEIPCGNTFEDILSFLKNLSSLSTFRLENHALSIRREQVRQKYLNYLLQEYGHVSIFGCLNQDLHLPLESVYVELKFDPTHPSIKAMKTVDMTEEFKRRVSSKEFFTDNEKRKILRAIFQHHAYNPQTIYRDLMIDQWLNVLLADDKIFSLTERYAIKEKISNLKRNILFRNNLKEVRQYRIRQAFNKFKHFVILGHPGSGKTTISKWLVTNMARQCLGMQNMLFNEEDTPQEKIPILIPIWKYVDQLKENFNGQKQSLLEFLYEHATFDASVFTDDERKDLSALLSNSLLHGNVL
ncbi:unnamed protein product, partial [Adineta ricciae]